MGFIQIVEYETDQPEEMMALTNQISTSTNQRWSHLSVTHDRDHPNRYFSVVEFPSYEVAMANSNAPETQAFARTMSELCTNGPTFHNLDVIREAP